MSLKKTRIAFVKFGGLSAGGTERWLQMMAANLPKEDFDVDYYYCHAAPYIGSDFQHPDTDPFRQQYLEKNGVHLIEFKVGAKDITKPTHDWVDTNFWEIFDESKYDLIQTAKAGPVEYPFHLLRRPVVEYVTLSAGVDLSDNIACSIHLSEWQRAQWFRAGGRLERSAVIPIPAEKPATKDSLREILGIEVDAVVAGFHQRNDNHIFSEIPLQAFSSVQIPNTHFIIMGGGTAYREQAKRLGLKNVHFIPHSADAYQISAFLNTLDLFAHGRKDGETFGTVFAEAMMHGLPCLSHCSEIANAQPETMGPAGLFASDGADYADKLTLLLTDSALRERLGSKGRKHAEEYYALDRRVDELVNVYKWICSVPRLKSGPMSERMPYGWSDMGFLYAGHVTSPASLAYCVMTGGIPEEYDVHVLRFFLPQVKTLLDVGANIGLYCFVAARYGGSDISIHAFEPQPDCCEAMLKTISLNNWENRVKVHAIGVGSTMGAMPLHLTGTGSTFDNAFNDNADLPVISVTIDNLDNQSDKLGIEKIDFIKIDVEGYEQEVLDGAVKIIKRDRPVIFVEIADSVRGRNYRNPNYKRTLNWLLEHGYSIWRVGESGELIKVDTNHSHDHIAMYLCLHGEQAQIVQSGLRSWMNEYRRGKAGDRGGLRLKRLAKAIRNPLWAMRRILARISRSDAVSRPEKRDSSYQQHHSEYCENNALERHRKVYATYDEDNIFDNAENKFGELLSKHPEVRGTAVDIGAGAGWLSARLSRIFDSVLAIEPSEEAVRIAKQLYPEEDYPNITWTVGFAEQELADFRYTGATLFITGCVLSHLPDAVVTEICASIASNAPPGSILGFAECWGEESHEYMWHVRTKDWWKSRFPGWELAFHGPEIQDVPGRHKGFHGIKKPG